MAILMELNIRLT